MSNLLRFHGRHKEMCQCGTIYVLPPHKQHIFHTCLTKRLSHAPWQWPRLFTGLNSECQRFCHHPTSFVNVSPVWKVCCTWTLTTSCGIAPSPSNTQDRWRWQVKCIIEDPRLYVQMQDSSDFPSDFKSMCMCFPFLSKRDIFRLFCIFLLMFFFVSAFKWDEDRKLHRQPRHVMLWETLSSSSTSSPKYTSEGSCAGLVKSGDNMR